VSHNISTRLADLLASHGDDVPLDQAAIAVALNEDPACDPAAVIDDLDTLAKATGHSPGVAPGRGMGRINEVLFRRFEFQGDHDNYHHLDNSLIHKVLGRRKGMPITLSLVYAEVARRLDIPLDGVGFPGHFVLRPRHSESPVFIDAFHQGRVLQEDQLWGLFQKTYPDAAISERAWQAMLAPVSNPAFIARICRNLKASHAMSQDAAGVARASRMLLVLEDGPEQYRDLGLALSTLGETAEATDALANYLATVPDAEDAPAITARLSMLALKTQGTRRS
jgi:regulator of sirC expression with transglutaminase-like and TPR domain